VREVALTSRRVDLVSVSLDRCRSGRLIAEAQSGTVVFEPILAGRRQQDSQNVPN
jgi:hypothetical protein